MSDVEAFSKKFLYGGEEEKVFQMVPNIWDKKFWGYTNFLSRG